MALSMTAFARKQSACSAGTLAWEIRSVNHRYLETSLRLPEAFRSLEPLIRDALRKSLGRGKIDCQLRLEQSDQTPNDYKIDAALVTKLNDASGQILSLTGGGAPLSVMEIMKWPGVMQEQESQDTDDLDAIAMDLFNETLTELIAARAREGEELHSIVSKRIKAIRDIVSCVRERMPKILSKQREALIERLAGLEVELDPSRLEQEVVLSAQKADVAEELDRLETHLNEVERVLDLKEPSGRRLDFLMQELNREANTLSSKSIVAETTLNAVDLKVLIEQMREQIQNIE
ncbi:MAG: YicC/YloC family endoribonuclease [Pseudohongiellaceae bacterium]|nr:YicC/YloC family endoribonuclease [Pseudohongiellaceae bacterium]